MVSELLCQDCKKRPRRDLLDVKSCLVTKVLSNLNVIYIIGCTLAVPNIHGPLGLLWFDNPLFSVDFSLFQSLSVSDSVTPWTAARQASLSITNSWSLLKLLSIQSVMPSNHLILCCPLLLLPSVFPSIKVFSSESGLCIRWLKYWSFSISPSNKYWCGEVDLKI